MDHIGKASRAAALALLATALLAGCAAKGGSVAAPGMDNIYDVEWVAQYIYEQPVVDMSHTSIVFSPDGKLAGGGGCNRYFGSYTLQGDTLAIAQPMGATMMACPEALEDQERRFLQGLREANRLELGDDGVLRIHSDNHAQPMRFTVQEGE